MRHKVEEAKPWMGAARIEAKRKVDQRAEPLKRSYGKIEFYEKNQYILRALWQRQVGNFSQCGCCCQKRT